MNKNILVKKILDKKIVAIIRMIDTEEALKVADALVNGGIELLEITLDSPNALNTISILTEKHISDNIVIGAGTVLDEESASQAILAGAEFLLSPSLNKEFIRICNRYDKVAIPGAMTPTEILTAKETGADIIKVFPAGTLGHKYIKSVKGPLKNINLMATGGINIENVTDFINSGSDSVGVGGSLVDKNMVKEKNYYSLTKLAEDFVKKINNN